MDKDTKQQQKILPKTKLSHVGGISNDAGGVDPEADKNLMRLSGGP